MAIVMAIIFMLFILIVLSRIKFHVEYHRNQQDDRLLVNVALFKGILKFQTELTGADVEKKLDSLSLDIDTEVKGEIGELEPGLNEKVTIPLTYRKLCLIYIRIRNLLKSFKYYKQVIFRVFNLTRIVEFNWTTQFGLGDAALTGVASGVVWGIKGIIIQTMHRVAQVYSTQVNVVPDFTGNTLNINLRCIFDIRIGHIIIAGIKFLIIRLQRGSDK